MIACLPGSSLTELNFLQTDMLHGYSISSRLEGSVLAQLTLQEEHPSIRPDAWAAEVARRLPHATFTQGAEAARAVLMALVDNLAKTEALALVAGIDPVMRPRLKIIVEARDDREPVADESLVGAVSMRLPRHFPHHACMVVRVVLAIIAETSTPAAVSSVVAATPPRWRKLWPQSDRRTDAYA
jgi:hypothetical protein